MPRVLALAELLEGECPSAGDCVLVAPGFALRKQPPGVALESLPVAGEPNLLGVGVARGLREREWEVSKQIGDGVGLLGFLATRAGEQVLDRFLALPYVERELVRADLIPVCVCP